MIPARSSAIVSPDSQAIACPLSGRNSTYRPVQISGTGSHHANAIEAIVSKTLRAGEVTWGLDYEIFKLGNVRLQRGGTLPDCKLAYKAFGKISAAKDNVIL